MIWKFNEMSKSKNEIINIIKKVIDADKRVRFSHEKSTDTNAIIYRFVVDNEEYEKNIFVKIGSSVVEFVEYKKDGMYTLVVSIKDVSVYLITEVINGCYYKSLLELLEKYEYSCKRVKNLMDQIPEEHRRV